MEWMEASSRFTAFVETYRDKIRKKIRLTREPESALDLRGELDVAYCLLNDRRLAVAYEPYASAKNAAPIFPSPTGPTWYSISKWRAYVWSRVMWVGSISRAKRSASCASCWISWDRCSPAWPTC